MQSKYWALIVVLVVLMGTAFFFVDSDTPSCAPPTLDEPRAHGQVLMAQLGPTDGFEGYRVLPNVSVSSYDRSFVRYLQNTSPNSANATYLAATQQMLADAVYSRSATDDDGCFSLSLPSSQETVLCIESWSLRCALLNGSDVSVNVTGNPMGGSLHFRDFDSVSIHVHENSSAFTRSECRAEEHSPSDLELRQVGFYITSTSVETPRVFVNISEFDNSSDVREQIASYTNAMQPARSLRAPYNCVPGQSCTSRTNHYWILARYDRPGMCEGMFTYALYLNDDIWEQGMELITYVAATAEEPIDHRLLYG